MVKEFVHEPNAGPVNHSDGNDQKRNCRELSEQTHGLNFEGASTTLLSCPHCGMSAMGRKRTLACERQEWVESGHYFATLPAKQEGVIVIVPLVALALAASQPQVKSPELTT